MKITKKKKKDNYDFWPMEFLDKKGKKLNTTTGGDPNVGPNSRNTLKRKLLLFADS